MEFCYKKYAEIQKVKLLDMVNLSNFFCFYLIRYYLCSKLLKWCDFENFKVVCY